MNPPSDSDPKYYIDGDFNEDMFMNDQRIYEDLQQSNYEMERKLRDKKEEEELKLYRELSVAKDRTSINNVKEAHTNIVNFIRSGWTKELDKLEKVNESIRPLKNDIDKIKLHKEHSEYKSTCTQTIQKINIKIEKDKIKKLNIENQITQYNNKRTRVETDYTSRCDSYNSELDKLKKEYEAKVLSIETKKEKEKSKYLNETYTIDSLTNLCNIQLQSISDEIDNLQSLSTNDASFTLTKSDYTKLRQLKTQLEPTLDTLNEWRSKISQYDDNLDSSLEAYYGKDLHKIDDDIINKYTYVRDSFNYEEIYSNMKHKIENQISEIDKLLASSTTT